MRLQLGLRGSPTDAPYGYSCLQCGQFTPRLHIVNLSYSCFYSIAQLHYDAASAGAYVTDTAYRIRKLTSTHHQSHLIRVHQRHGGSAPLPERHCGDGLSELPVPTIHFTNPVSYVTWSRPLLNVSGLIDRPILR